MFRDLKYFLIFWKVIGLLPVRNILRNDHTQWKIDILNIQTFVTYGILKTFLMGVHIFLLRRKGFALIFELLLATGSVILDFTQITCARKLINVCSQLALFDRHTLSAPPRRTPCKYFWTILEITFVCGYILLYHLITGEPPSLEILRRWSMYVPLYFARFSVPLTFVILCSELSYRFNALRDHCEFVGRQMNPGIANVFIFRPWPQYRRRVLEIRKAYSLLCLLAEDFTHSFDVPITWFLIIMLSEAGWYCFVLAAIRDGFHGYRVVRLTTNSCLICMCMERMDKLRESALDFIRIIRKWQFRHLPMGIQDELESFLIQIEHNPLAKRFNDFGYVSVSRKMILPLTMSFVTFVIVLAQISPQLMKYFEKSE